jgi:formamidase
VESDVGVGSATVAGYRIEIVATRPLVDDPTNGHNRWHPAIPPVLEVEPGASVLFQLRDGLDVQIRPDSTTDDVLALDINRGHPMTGPVYIRGAEPGDLLDVEILDVTAADWGYTIIMPNLGALDYRFSEPFVVKWDLRGGVARSMELPGVAIPGEPFLGVIGVAPSPERVGRFTARERALLDTGALVMPPDPRGAVPNSAPAATEGLRTVPPRENGGNMDVKQLTEGTRVTFVVEVPGALVSVGDPHFAQGDGESCGVAIEMAAETTLRFSLRKADQVSWRPTNPVFEYTSPTRTAPAGRRYIATTGLSLDRDGSNHFLDVYLAARNAIDELVNYLVAERGYTENQAYVLVSVAADLKISEIVDVPNALVSAALPLDIFETPS